MRSPEDFPEDILIAAEKALDTMLCNCTESCGGTDGLRRASIKDIARALLAERLSATEDAKRYRWLRAGNAYVPEEEMCEGGAGLDELCDEGIAAAIRSQP
jgi:hypothetical protein